MRQNRVATALEYGKDYIYRCETCGEERSECDCGNPYYETELKTIRLEDAMDGVTHAE